MKTIRVHTREKRNGEWWSSTTLKGVDISVTRKTAEEARERIKVEIEKIDKNVSTWEATQNYVHDVKKVREPVCRVVS